MKTLLTLSLLLALKLLAMPEQSSTNYLIFPGWEENFSPWYHMLEYGGTVQRVSPGHSGKWCLSLQPTLKNNQYKAVCRQWLPRLNYWGGKGTLKIMAKGKGMLRLGLFLARKNNKGQTCRRDLESPLFQVSDEWREFKYDFRFTLPEIELVGVMISAEGKDSSILADNAVFHFSNPDLLRAENTLIELPAGKTAEVKFSADPKIKEVMLYDGAESRKQAASPNGEYHVRSVPGASFTGIHALQEVGGAATLIHYRDESEWKRLDAMASQIRLKRLLRLLFLGDSLSDFDRGFNYVDKTVFWLNKYNPGKVTFRNAGVAGDYTLTVLKRLNGNPYVFGKFRYDNLLNEKYDYVFLFIGHNDTQKTWRPQKKSYIPTVSQEELNSSYRTLLSFIHRHWGAKIIVIAPVCMDFEQSEERCADAIKNNSVHTIFGDPVLLGDFIRITSAAAKEANAGYLNLYQASLNAGEKKSFFTNDGVHLTRQGNDFVAEQLLQFCMEYLQ